MAVNQYPDMKRPGFPGRCCKKKYKLAISALSMKVVMGFLVFAI
jgi:hypothetical protein